MTSSILQDAVDTLSGLARWRLDQLRWQLVEQSVEAVEQALDLGDENLLQAATADLELLGPVRWSGIGDRKGVDIPPVLLERVTILALRLLRLMG
jgi:CATRA-Associated Small Protein